MFEGFNACCRVAGQPSRSTAILVLLYYEYDGVTDVQKIITILVVGHTKHVMVVGQTSLGAYALDKNSNINISTH